MTPYVMLSVLCAAVPSRNLTGIYTYAGHEVVEVQNAVESSTAGLSLGVRMQARRRLTVEKLIPKRVEIQLTGDRGTIQMGDLHPPSAPLDGTPVQWTTPENRTAQVSIRWEGDTLVHTIQGKRGKRICTASLVNGGRTLLITVEVIGAYLSKPLRYRLTYEPSSQ